MSRSVPRSRPDLRTTIGRTSLLLLVFLLLTPAVRTTAQLDPGGVFAVHRARLVTAPGRVVERGTIVVRGGLIEAVGRDVQPPADAVVIDGEGLTVYPGFIDAFSQVGLVLPPVREREPAPNIAEHTADAWFDPAAEGLTAYRRQGFTTALVARNDGVFSGQAVVMNLAGEDTRAMTVRSRVVQVLTYSGQRDYPSTLMAVVAYQRQTLIDTQYQQMLLERYARRPQGMERPPHDAALEALIPAASGQAPFLVDVHTENDIKRLRALGEEFGIRYWITGAQEGHRVVDLLKSMGVPVIVSLDLPTPERVTGYWFDRAYRNLDEEQSKELDDRDNAAIRGNAATLVKAGLTVALCTSGMSSPDRFLANLRLVVAAGLSPQDALKALTVTPATLFGLADRLGTLEVGKIADLTVASGDLFTSDEAFVTHLFVDGRMESFEQPRPRGASGSGGGRAAGTVAGTWALSLSLQGEAEAVTLTLTQEGTAVRGEILSPMGPVAVSGTFEEGRLVVSGQVPDAGTLSFSATVDGDTLSGTIALGPMEGIEVTGRKRPSTRSLEEGGSRHDR
jgi:imidazolonepropionase-like amidohydrolase